MTLRPIAVGFVFLAAFVAALVPIVANAQDIGRKNADNEPNFAQSDLNLDAPKPYPLRHEAVPEAKYSGVQRNYPIRPLEHTADKAVPVRNWQTDAISPWGIDVGMRYWLSSGRYQKTLYDKTGATRLSRLTYDNLTGNTAEAFWKAEHDSGFFFKGYIGGGSVTGGRMNDEDFPPAATPYSSTAQTQGNGSMRYFSIDAGYDFIADPAYKVGGFLGYHYWNEHLNTYGCSQTASNAAVCGGAGFPQTTNTLDEDAVWNSLRVGIAGEAAISPALKITGDLAYARSYLTAHDFHNLRPDIRGILEDGAGNGIMADALLNYQLTPAFSIGLGARWWHIQTDGHAHFEQTVAGGQPSVLNVEQDRYGILMQANYRFGVDEPVFTVLKRPPSPMLPRPWSGFYVGVNTGYGASWTNAEFAGLSSNANLSFNFNDAPLSRDMTTAGFLGGIEGGYNWQVGDLVYGIEADLDYAHIGGSSGETSNLNRFTTTVDQYISWLGTGRARFGKLASENTLIYASGGIALGGVNLAVDVHQAVSAPCSSLTVCSTGSTSVTKAGWTAGAGVEYAITNQVTLKAEYLYVDLGSAAVTTADTGRFAPFIYNVTSKFDANLIRTGLNWRF